MPIELPVTSVRVGGERFKVALGDLLEEWGTLSPDERVIHVSKEVKTVARFRRILEHEMIHASLVVAGMDEFLDPKTEEAIVRCIDNIFLPALRRLDKRFEPKPVATPAQAPDEKPAV